MGLPFVGQILIVAFNFPPKGWATCDGQLLPIGQNTALYDILSTSFGGDGTSTFRIPNLQNATPIGTGQGPGLSNYELGAEGGVSDVTIINANVPSHSHQLSGDTSVSTSGAPSGTAVFGVTKGAKPGALSVYGDATNLVAFDSSALSNSPGTNQPHNNRQPYQGLLFIIALSGIFPTRP